MNLIQLVNSATHIKGNTPYLVFFSHNKDLISNLMINSSSSNLMDHYPITFDLTNANHNPASHAPTSNGYSPKLT